MNIKNRLLLFFERTLWIQDISAMSTRKAFLYRFIQRAYLTLRSFIVTGLSREASALTYATMLAIVPLLTIIFAISRGFGYNTLLEEKIRTSFSNQPQVVDVIINFVNSYLLHTKNGIFIGFGLVLLFGTLISLVNGIERCFNSIWQIKHGRSTSRMLVDYSAVMLLLPVCFILSVGLNVFITTQLDALRDIYLFQPIVRFGIAAIPFVLMSFFFTALYLFMPNTRVQFRGAVIAGILAGALFQLVQHFYINSQIWMSSYNAIYGSFAALPLFMLWCQISWNICLFCAQLSYTDQNIDRYYYGKETMQLSLRIQRFVALMLMRDICTYFAQHGLRYTAEQLAARYNMPIRLINDILYHLCSVGMLVEINNDKSKDQTYIPAKDIHRITIGDVVSALDKQGDEVIIRFTTANVAKNWAEYKAIRHELFTQETLKRNIQEL